MKRVKSVKGVKRFWGCSCPAPACAACAAEVERKERNGKAGCGIVRRRWRLCHDPAFRFDGLAPPEQGGAIVS